MGATEKQILATAEEVIEKFRELISLIAYKLEYLDEEKEDRDTY